MKVVLIIFPYFLGRKSQMQLNRIYSSSYLSNNWLTYFLINDALFHSNLYLVITPIFDKRLVMILHLQIGTYLHVILSLLVPNFKTVTFQKKKKNREGFILLASVYL